MHSTKALPAVRWELFRHINIDSIARSWMTWQMNRGLAQNMLDACGQALDHYLAYLTVYHTSYEPVSRAESGTFVRDLPGPEREVASASAQLALTVVRLFHGYLVEEGVRSETPMSRGDARTRGFAPQAASLVNITMSDAKALPVLAGTSREVVPDSDAGTALRALAKCSAGALGAKERTTAPHRGASLDLA